MPDTIYLDNNATTQPLPEVVDAVAECLRTQYANPSSVHQFGQTVRHAVEQARRQVADLIGAESKEVVFTSGGTESINLALRGGVAERPGKRRVVTTAVEHSAVLRVVEQLEEEGYEVVRVGVDVHGRQNADEWSDALTKDTAIASILHVNNETGVIFDVTSLAQVAADRGIPVHVDAVQSVGKLPINVHDWPAAYVSMSAHKFHGPKGVGALYVRRRARLHAQIVGGSQERLLRGGTEHVPGILGMGVAAMAAKREMNECAQRIGAMRDAFERGVLETIPFARVHGAESPRIYNTSNIGFENLQADAILILLSEAGICASAGAACSSGSLEPSHVLKAMGIEDRFAHGAIRFSFSRFNTPAEVQRAVAALPNLLGRLTSLAGR